MDMKHLYILCCCCMAATALPLSAQDTEDRAQAVEEAAEAHRFKIAIDYMNPLHGRAQALTTPYSVEVRNDSLFSYLPYVGKAYNVPYGGGKALNFDAPIVRYETRKDKKGRTEVCIRTRNEEDSYVYRFTIHPDGSTYLNVQPSYRQSIAFSGNLDMESE